MRKVEEKSMGVIWFDSSTNQYQYGSWRMFHSATKTAKQDLEIIYEIKHMTAKLASKIVMELNAARFESDTRHGRAA